MHVKIGRGFADTRRRTAGARQVAGQQGSGRLEVERRPQASSEHVASGSARSQHLHKIVWYRLASHPAYR